MNSQVKRWQPGETVELEVTRVTPFGTYLSDGNAEVLVLATNEQWPTERNSRSAVGERVRVKILGYSESEKVHLGSLRALREATNPYRHFAIGQEVAATVVHVGTQSALVEIATDVTASLTWPSTWGPPHPGDRVRGRVTLVDPEYGKLELIGV